MSNGKVRELILSTWRNKVLPDSYPPLERLDVPSMQAYIGAVYAHLLTTLRPVLRRWMVPASEAQIESWLRQLVNKSTVFCAMVTAGEIESVAEVAEAGVSIALVYWTDHAMDRGDRAMEEALHRYLHRHWPAIVEPAPAPSAPPALVRTRTYGLERLRSVIEQLTAEEDRPFVMREAFIETLWREMEVARLSRRYREMEEEERALFWARHADELARHTVRMNGLIYVTSVIYALYRRRDPRLPSLAAIEEARRPVEMLSRQPSLAIRLFDDWGDRLTDEGKVAGWDLFSINLFNQPHPRYLEALLEVGDIDGRSRPPLMEALRRRDVEMFSEIILQEVRRAYRACYRALPDALHPFLRLSQRVMEAGYANIVGDLAMSD